MPAGLSAAEMEEQTNRPHPFNLCLSSSADCFDFLSALPMLDQGMAPWEQNRSENREISQVEIQEELPLRKSGNALAQLPREVVKSPSLELLKNHRDTALRDMANGHCGDGLTDFMILVLVFFFL